MHAILPVYLLASTSVPSSLGKNLGQEESEAGGWYAVAMVHGAEAISDDNAWCVQSFPDLKQRIQDGLSHEGEPVKTSFA